LGVKILISVSLLLYLIHRVGGVHQVLLQIQGIRRSFLLWAFLLYMGAVLLGSVKWFVLLQAQGVQVPYRALVKYTLIGAFFNNVLPANVGGDVVRGYGLAHHTARSEAAVSVVIDRLVGLFAFLTAAAVAGSVLLLAASRGWTHLSPQGWENVRVLTALAWAAVGGMGGMLGILLSRRSKRWLEEVLQRMGPARPLLPVFHRVAQALNAYRHAYRALVGAVCISWGVLVLTSLENWILAYALQPGRVPFLYVLLFNPLIAFALLIPLSVGGVGIGQSAYVFFYSLVNVPERLAFTLSLVHQLLVYASSLPGALLWLTRRS